MALSTITLVTLVALATAPPDATGRREHCGISSDVATSLGIPSPLPAGEEYQIRIGVTAPAGSAGNTANCTVTHILTGTNRLGLYPSSPAATGNNGGIYKVFNQNTLPASPQATLWNQAPSSTTLDGSAFGDSFTEPTAGKSFTEAVKTGTDDLLIFAPHGGAIETGTSDQLATIDAELAILGTPAAVWDAQGTWGSGQTHRRWHVTSEDINTVSFPGLDHLVDTYTTWPHALALHGFTWDETTDTATWKRGIVIGGRASLTHKQTIKDAIEDEVGVGVISFVLTNTAGADVAIAGLDGNLGSFSKVSELRGTSTQNIVNRLSPTGGIQIEQSRGIRDNDTLAEQVAIGLANALHDLATP